MKLTVEELDIALINSVFNRPCGEYDISGDIGLFNKQLAGFTGVDRPRDAMSPLLVLGDDDLWSTEMKQAYLLNVLGGMESTITLSSIDNGVTFRIIDGLQPATAVYEFIKGFLSLECGLDSRDIKKNYPCNAKIRIYHFQNEKEEAEFHLKMSQIVKKDYR